MPFRGWSGATEKSLVWHESVIKADKSMAIGDAWPPRFILNFLIGFWLIFYNTHDGNRFMVTTVLGADISVALSLKDW